MTSSSSLPAAGLFAECLGLPVCVLLKPPPSAHAFLNIQIQLVNHRPEQTRKSSQPDIGSSPSRPSSESSFAQVAHATTSTAPRDILGQSVHSSPVSEHGSEASEALSGAALSRTSSSRSNRSSSGSSFFSTTSRRATTPLYNLEYHRVLPTVITDAGTDARVARVLKRGIEVHELAQIEAVEMTADGQRPPTLTAMARTMTSEGATLSAAKTNSTATAAQDTDALSDAASAESATPSAHLAKDNSFMGRFKRMSFIKPKDVGFKPPASLLKAPTFSTFKAPAFVKQPAPPQADAVAHHENGAHHQLQAPPQALGMFKTEAPSGLDETPLGKHATGYVWKVRKFLRPDLEGKEALLDLTIEWKKRKVTGVGGASDRRRRKNAGDRSVSQSRSVVSSPLSTPAGSPPTSDSALPGSPSEASDAPPRPSADTVLRSPAVPSSDASQTPHPRQLGQVKDEDKPRRSTSSARSAATGGAADVDSGEESDPEDSESPWVCELVLPPPATAPANADGSTRPTRRIRLGVFKPAPHHPRLIGQVSIPLSLRRVSLGLPSDPEDEDAGSESMSAEEMKDLLCITLLWMCIRESLGGVANRKKNEGPFRNL